MNDFQGLLSGDYGFKPQGKSAPMAPRSSPNTSNPVFDFDIPGSSSTTAAVRMAPYSKPSDSSVFLDDHDGFSRSSSSVSSRKKNDFDNLGVLDSIFNGPGDSGSRFSSLPVFDKPVYDDEHDSSDDLLGGLGRKEPESKGLGGSGRKNDKDIPAFDDLLPGFGARTAPSNRNPLDSSWDKQPTGRGEAETTTDGENPFVVLKTSSYSGPSSQALYDDPLEQFSTLGSPSSKKVENVASTKGLFGDIDTFGGSSSKKSENTHAGGGLFNDIDPLGGLGNSVPLNDKEKIGSPDRAGRTVVGQTSASVEARERSFSIGSPQRNFEEKMAPEEYHESANIDTYSAPVDFRTAQNTFSAPCVNATDDTTSQRHTSTVYDSKLDSSDDVWLTVSEVPLYTQPTAAPPPSRPPPPKPARILKAGHGSNIPKYAKKKIVDHSAFPTSAQFFQTPKSHPAGGTSSFASQVDELEDFAKGRSWNDADRNSDALSGYCLEKHSDAAASAAAMKEAMDRAEAKFKHAKETRERENAKAGRMQQEREDRKVSDFQEREFRERQERERQLRQDEERKQREEEERMRREREAKQKEQRRIERERIEREHVKQAVERATREARERAAADARARAEKAAVKAQTEARERAERNVVFKAQAEARERAGRAAAEAKQRADREKAEREARSKAEREAKEKEARDKAAASAVRANQQKNENDLESFFGMGSRASSAPRPRAGSSVDPFFDTQFPKKQSDSVRTSVGSTTSIRKTPSSANIVDDLSSFFGGAPSAGQFQEFEGETEERRIARLQRHQRTQERAAKALAEKNQRDLDVQKEQAERHRIGETFDIEIKRWAAGKEGNLRALLSTLQYVLWPECGWQAVSLTDLITGAAVKKAYRKATLCIHPDKVQQKGANLQQKYVAEKVFDLLKEAWNKFNSEELF